MSLNNQINRAINSGPITSKVVNGVPFSTLDKLKVIKPMLKTLLDLDQFASLSIREKSNLLLSLVCLLKEEEEDEKFDAVLSSVQAKVEKVQEVMKLEMSEKKKPKNI